MAYFSNGSEGTFLEDQCAECKLADDAPCPVLFVQYEYNYSQHGNDDLIAAMNILIDKTGRCQMKLVIDNNLRR